MTEETWRQANIKKAQAARSHAAEEKWAEKLRSRGWVCFRPDEQPTHNITINLSKISDGWAAAITDALNKVTAKGRMPK